MKKFAFIIICLVLLVKSTSAQITGDGKYATPYTGTISSPADNKTIPTGVSYFGVISITGGGTLTITAGATLLAKATNSEISANAGVLSAIGSSGSPITFSADNNGNGNYDAGESWRSIVLLNNVSGSIIDNAIIEYGMGYSLTNQGGGIYINGRGVTVKNSTILNCTANGSGGGIYALSTGTPPGGIRLENLNIHNNISGSTGGGLFLAGSGDPINVLGCKVYNNSGTSGSGIYNNSQSSIRTIVNSLIYNNISGSGDGIYSVQTNGPNIINCTIVSNNKGLVCGGPGSPSAPVVNNSIIWGNTTSQILGSGTPVITYSGIEGGFLGTGNYSLAGINENPSGPNFTNPGGSDWSLKFISPLMDKGTSGGSPTPPSTDKNGKNRVFNYDMGAYEVQYNRWTGASSTIWSTAGNWSGNVDPIDGTGDVVIPTGLSVYPDVSTNQDFTIASGKFMYIESGAKVTLDVLTNNGTLNLNSDAGGIASLMINSYSKDGGAIENIQLYLTGGANSLWHYISPPVSTVSTTVFSSLSEKSVIRYEENYITNDWNNGWVNYEGYHYNPMANEWQAGAGTWSTLEAGRGYNYHSSTNRTYTVSGQINTSDKSITLDYATGGAGTPSYQGYNLIGNPFTSGINWDNVVSANSSLFSGETPQVEQAIYFRSNGTLNTYLSGVSVPDGWSGGLIPPMQGFFIKSNTNGVNLTIPASAKAHTSNPRLKGSSIIPLIRLQIDNSGKSDQAVIRFDDKATISWDNEFDARKLYPDNSIPSISTSISGTEYTINGIPFPHNYSTIPVVFRAPVSGTYSITAKELTGLENYKVTLTDKDLNFTTKLSEVNSYSFYSPSGKYSDRFILTISDINSSIPEVGNSKAEFNIYFSQGAINIQTIGESWKEQKGDISIFDFTGRQLLIKKNNEFQPGGLLQIPVSFRTGAYLVEIRSGIKRYVGKVVLK